MSNYYYQYSVLNDIAGQALDIGQLDSTIRNDGQINTNFLGITQAGDYFETVYSAELNASDKTYLDGVVNAHVPTTDTGNTSIYVKETSATMTQFKLKQKNNYYDIAHYVYRGTTEDYSLKKVQFYLKVEGNITGFGLRILNLETGDIITETSNFTLANNNLYSLTNITNLPSDISVLQVQLKKNDGKGKYYIYIYSIDLYF